MGCGTGEGGKEGEVRANVGGRSRLSDDHEDAGWWSVVGGTEMRSKMMVRLRIVS